MVCLAGQGFWLRWAWGSRIPPLKSAFQKDVGSIQEKVSLLQNCVLKTHHLKKNHKGWGEGWHGNANHGATGVRDP